MSTNQKNRAEKKLCKADFDKLTKVQLHQLLYNEALTKRKIAKMYNITRKEVVEKVKKYKLSTLNCSVLYILNKGVYGNNKNKVPR